MAHDPDRIRHKTAYILEQVRALRELSRSASKEEILYDPWTYRGVKYALQTAIEALIDLAYHISAKKFAHAPADARDALRSLLEHGALSTQDYQVYSAMVGLRNRIVHGYEEVEPERIYKIITEELGDLEKFVRQITALTGGEA